MNYVIWDNVNNEYVKSDNAGYGDKVFTFDEAESFVGYDTDRYEVEENWQ